MPTNLEFGTSTISLEAYLERADGSCLKDHDRLSTLIEHIDPRLMVPFQALEERLIPLLPEDLKTLREVAFIHPTELAEKITFYHSTSTIENPNWWEVLGDSVNQVEVFRLNLRLTTTEIPDWDLLLLRRFPEIVGDDNFSVMIGWVSKVELDVLKLIASESR